MKLQRANNEFEDITEDLDQVIEHLIKAPLEVEGLEHQLQEAAGRLQVVLSSNRAIFSRDEIKPFMTAIKQRTRQVERLLDSAATLSCGLVSTSNWSALSYGARGEEKPDSASWRMKLEA